MTLTKEQLIDQAQKNIAVLRGAVERIPGASEAAVIHLRLAEITLAALTAEPVAWTTGGYSQNIGCNFGEKESGEAPCIAAVYWDRNVFRHHADCEETSDKWLAEAIKNTGAKPLYAAPPAPVVPAQSVYHDADCDSLRPRVVNGVFVPRDCDCRAAMLQGTEPVSQHDELPLDYLQGQKDGLEWAARMAEANHPETGDWLYDDPLELAKAIRKGPDMPEAAGNSPVIPDGYALVPVEPTRDMKLQIHPIAEATCMDCGRTVTADCEDNVLLSWADMIAAAPQQEVK